MYPPTSPDPLEMTAFAYLGVVAPFVDSPRVEKEALYEMTPGFFTFTPAVGALPFDALVVFLAPLASSDHHSAEETIFGRRVASDPPWTSPPLTPW
jgi:hypothetical protein